MKAKIWFIVMLAGTLASCNTSQPQTAAPAEPELPTLSVTLWSERTELFMEHPELVRGENAAFAVHLTDLATYQPLAEGSGDTRVREGGQSNAIRQQEAVEAWDIPSGRAARMQRVDTAAVLKVRAPKLEDRHDLGEIGRIREQGRGSRSRQRL